MPSLDFPAAALRVSAALTLALWVWGEWRKARRNPAQITSSALVWTLGASSLALHILIAFEVRHHWSHAAAVTETAQQTEATFGVAWGGGVWINYGFLAWWALDAIRSWRPRYALALPSSGEWLRRAVFLFLWFNAAVVFAHGAFRLLGIAACLLVVRSWIRPLATTPGTPNAHQA